MKEIRTTLLLIIKDNQILLAEKLRGFGKGKINGVGGKVEPNETIDDAMIRETNEEIGVVPLNWEKRAIITFDECVKGERQKVIMSAYVATDYVGEPAESDEMKPMFFPLSQIPYDRMFPDDEIWFPYFLKGDKFEAYFKFDEDFNILSHEINVVEEI